jgi:RNA polymerase sigma factor (sigma-70 family)
MLRTADMSDVPRVSDLLDQWKSGSQAAANELYHRYAQRLCQQVERRIGQHLQGRFEAADVLQSAFRTFFRRAASGAFQIDHTGDLWNLLVTITLNKIRGQVQHHCASKRDPRRELRIGDQVSPDEVACEPSEAEATALDDELETLLAKLGGTEAEIVRLRLAGQTTVEIASRIGCSRVTVWRKLDRVSYLLRTRLQKFAGQDYL